MNNHLHPRHCEEELHDEVAIAQGQCWYVNANVTNVTNVINVTNVTIKKADLRRGQP